MLFLNCIYDCCLFVLIYTDIGKYWAQSRALKLLTAISITIQTLKIFPGVFIPNSILERLIGMFAVES